MLMEGNKNGSGSQISSPENFIVVKLKGVVLVYEWGIGNAKSGYIKQNHSKFNEITN
jgi:hypothetical protein